MTIRAQWRGGVAFFSGEGYTVEMVRSFYANRKLPGLQIEVRTKEISL